MLSKTKHPYTFLCAKVYRSMASGCRGTPHFRRYEWGAGFETDDLVKEKGVGGATVERLDLIIPARKYNILDWTIV